MSKLEMTSTVLDLGKMISAIENKDNQKVYSSNLEALMDSHLWDIVKTHLTSDATWILESACGSIPRDLTDQEKMYLDESDEEDYHDDGYDRWDQLYNDDERDEWFNDYD